MQQKISVVICAYTMERFKDTLEAVDSALHQTMKPQEVIVAVDHNEELFHRFQIELPAEVKVTLNNTPYKGSSATDNVGVSIATGDIIAFMDDDAIAENTWLENLLKPYKNPAVMAVGGNLTPIWVAGRPNWFAEELNWAVGCIYKGHPEDRTEVRALIFCNASIRRTVLDSVGMFPAESGRISSWGTGFEAQFFMQLKAKMPDGLIIYEPDAVVHHKVTPQRATLRYLIRRSYNEGVHKAIIEKASVDLVRKPLSTENSYLRFLIFNAIPRRLTRFYNTRAIAEASGIMISITVTGIGYLKGKFNDAS